MANNVEFRDSGETGDTARYLTAYTALSAGNGRGGSRAIQCNGTYAKVSVSAEADKVMAMAWYISHTNTGHSMSFTEGTTQHVTITSNTLGKLEVRRGSSGGTLLATSTTKLLYVGDFPHIEAKVTVHDTTGSVQVRVNEATVSFDNSLTNIDTRNGGTGVIDQCWFGSVIDNDWLDDIVIQYSGSDWIGDVRVLYSAAASAGTYTDGTATGAGTILQCVDEAPHNTDTDYIAQDNSGLPKAASFGITAAPSNVIAILDVAPVVLCRKDDAGSDLVRGLLISGATEDDGGADVAPITSYTNIFGAGAGGRHYQTDPNTSAAWTISNFNAIEVGRRRVA